MKTILTIIAVLALTLSSHAAHAYRSDRLGDSPALPGVKGGFIMFIFTEKDKHGTGSGASKLYIDDYYQTIFPGCNPHVSDAVSYTGEGSRNGAIGLTSLQPESDRIVRLGNHSPRIAETKVEVFNSGDWDTYFHEMSHAYNASLRGNTGGYHFFDEGMAVMTNWAFNYEKMEDEAISMRGFASRIHSPDELKAAFLSLGDKVPEGHSYPFAGFFMLQIYDLSGPSTLKYLITADSRTDSFDHVYQEILRGLANGPHGGLTESQFWSLMFERLNEWIR